MELLEALLAMANEHQQEADYARSMMDPAPERTRGPIGDVFRALQREMNEGYRNRADEQQGLADVYYRMADRLAVAVWLDGVMATR